AARHGRAACDIGRRQEVADLEGVGLAQEGVARVVLGEVEAGMRLLDEASAIVHGEDLHVPISMAWALCYLIAACEGVGDFPRAAQWCEAMRTLGERWHGRQVLGTCRTAYGRILVTRGDWPGAETELSGAVADFAAAAPGMSATSLVRLGELRRLQGRVEEARELYERAGAHPDAIVALGELALEEGDALVAREAAERVLRRLPERSVLDRLPALELRARALSALGEHEAAAAVGAEVAGIAARLGTPYLRGRAHRVMAEAAAARGDCEAARCEAEDAVDGFAAADAPHDAATARLLLARALRALDRAPHAAAEARAAREAFARLGAVRDLARADALLAELRDGGDGPAPGARAPEADAALGELTARELDVLRLVARGLSDAEIARELVLSPHTVHRHVANARTKLRLPSRAAAVAYASRAGLL
ncbi:MAG: helix-turn-helix transcriptional regulator, partial [Solirubrobacteraceae bacterium]|nr:helix-turn-helix transcriptional regulator [Solirubrobacteraceae bacterium]